MFYFREDTLTYGHTVNLKSFSPALDLAAKCLPRRARVAWIDGNRWIVVRRDDTPWCDVELEPYDDVSRVRFTDLICQAGLLSTDAAISMCFALIDYAYDGFPLQDEYTSGPLTPYLWRVRFSPPRG